MFSKRLRTLVKIQERVSHARLLSSSRIPRANLTLAQNHQQKLTLLYSKPLISPRCATNNYSKLSEASASDDPEENVDDNEDDVKWSENGYAYEILKKSNLHGNTVVPQLIANENISDETMRKTLTKDYSDCSPQEVLEDFRILSFHRQTHPGIVISSEEHDRILCLLKIYLDDYNDEELLDLFKYLNMWYPMKDEPEGLLQLKIAMDKQCCNRIASWDLNKKLTFCDLFYQLRYIRKADFVDRVVAKMGLKPARMTTDNYLQFMFLCNVGRKPAINMYELEYRLESIIQDFTAEQLGLISMAFFKTKTPIRNPHLLNTILDKAMENIHTIGDIPLAAIMKITRYSIGLKETDKLRSFLRAFVPRIPQSSLPLLIHTAHVAATILMDEKDVLDLIVERFQENLSEARLKDLERMLFVLSIFNYPMGIPIYERIIEELRTPRRQPELKTYAKCFVSALVYLSNAGIYPQDLFKIAMDPKFIAETTENNAYKAGPNYLRIDSSLRIEVPDYDGDTLSPKLHAYLAKRNTSDDFNTNSSSVSIQSHFKFMFDVVHLVKDIVGASNAITVQLLPHHMRLDIVLCLDQDNNFISPQPFFPQAKAGIIRYTPKDQAAFKWIAIVLASRNHIFKSTSKPSGIMCAKLRQLKKIGYTPLVVGVNEWEALKTRDRKKYLEDLIMQCRESLK